MVGKTFSEFFCGSGCSHLPLNPLLSPRAGVMPGRGMMGLIMSDLPLWRRWGRPLGQEG